MKKKCMILNVAKNNNGVVLTSQVKSMGISTKFLTELVREGMLRNVQKGI